VILAAAALLSIERLCYVWVAWAPASFRQWCARPTVARLGEPVVVVRTLFWGFKALQLSVFAGWCYLHGGGSSMLGEAPVAVLAAGALLIVAGQILNGLVFYRLGRVGTFYGDRLGYDVVWCEAFPFSMLTHPQYIGTVMSIWGFFVIAHFPHDDWYLLPVLESVYYALGAYLETCDAPTPVRPAPGNGVASPLRHDLGLFLNGRSALPHGDHEVVPEARFRTIWLSDIHLGTRGCRAEALLEFLETHECEFLYLVGDIIDFWRLKRSPYWPQVHSDVIRRVLSMARAGTLVTFVPGNHDEYLRRFCDLQLGNILVVREAVHRTADGRLLLVLHGDEFDAVTRCHRWIALLGDVGYDCLTVLNRWFNTVRRVLGFGYWSLAGYVKWKVKRAVMYIGDFESAVAREAAHRGMAGVVCGHIHKAALRSVGPVLYANTGDWVESCSALVEREDGTLVLLSFAERVHRVGRALSGPEGRAPAERAPLPG
jgi:UDP-2,3-diacylglucosamine pyrophosphatase LpxH